MKDKESGGILHCEMVGTGIEYRALCVLGRCVTEIPVLLLFIVRWGSC